MKRFSLLLTLTIGLQLFVQAQEFSGGFKAGLNFSRIDGPFELDTNGSELESVDFLTGFHVGATFNLKLNDYFGFRGEFLYSQKGTDYQYSGPSYWVFFDDREGRVFDRNGSRTTSLKISTTYLEIPLSAYVRVGRVEVSGGVYAAFLVSASADGSTTYTSFGLGNNEQFTANLDYNYFSDDPVTEIDLESAIRRSIAGRNVFVPETLSTYYESTDSDEKYFRRFDFGLNGQVAFFLNRGLFLGFRMNYGLTDLTKEAQDLSKTQLSGDNFVTRDDNDTNFSLQASIGFSF